MEGDLCPLGDLIDLCRRYEATLVVDDSHGIGVVGRTGRGTPEHFERLGEIDVITGTLGKALGGAAGGYVAASEQAISLLEQRARTSLFSNALPATVAYSARKAIEILLAEPERVAKLRSNVVRIREGLRSLGYEVHESPTAIVPVMIGDEAEALRKSARLMELGVMAIGFAFPVVPRGKARIRVQVSAALEEAHLERALDAFAKL
jgi:glycine C-acetyltransferase